MHRAKPLRRLTVVVLALVLATVTATASQANNGGERGRVDEYTPLAVSVMAKPHPVDAADGKTHLLYELLLLNPFPATTTVERLEVLDPGRGNRVVANLDAAALDATMSSIASEPGRTIGPARAYRVFLDVTPPATAVPRSLLHRLTVTTEPDLGLTTRFVVARTAVATQRAPIVGPPLQGGNWVHVAGCCDSTGSHRGFPQTLNGGIHLSQRFAVDVVQLDAEGRLFNGPPDQVTSYPGYGDPVLSTSGGVVVTALDDRPNQVPLQAIPPDSADDIPGNHVVVAMGDGRYAFYAHLKPGSVAVRAGDRVRPGQRLGQVGNSGFSDLPHLHFHIMDTPSPLASDGLPFVLSSFDSPGSVPEDHDITQPIPVPILPIRAGHFERKLPMNLQVVEYPPAR